MSDDDFRDLRQAKVANWAIAAFGHEEATSLPQRGLRLLEEAIEAFQACGGGEAIAHKLVAYVFGRPSGAIGQELGGVAVTVLALAAAVGLSADEEECREIQRVLSKPLKEFTERNANKNAAGFKISTRPLKDLEVQDDGVSRVSRYLSLVDPCPFVLGPTEIGKANALWAAMTHEERHAAVRAMRTPKKQALDAGRSTPLSHTIAVRELDVRRVAESVAQAFRNYLDGSGLDAKNLSAVVPTLLDENARLRAALDEACTIAEDAIPKLWPGQDPSPQLTQVIMLDTGGLYRQRSRIAELRRSCPVEPPKTRCPWAGCGTPDACDGTKHRGGIL